MVAGKNKQLKLSSAQKRNEQTEEGRKEKARYLEVKKEVMAHEPKNFGKLYLIKSTGKGNYWKMFEHSALLYHYKVAPRIGRDSRIYPDTDREYKAEHGTVSTSNIDSFIKAVGILKTEVEFRTDEVVIIKLDVRYKKEDIIKLYNIEKEKIERINTLVVPERLLPQLQKKIKLLSTRIHECVRKMESATREDFGAEMDRDVLWIHLNVIQVQNNKKGDFY